jgi:hypothetical protein
MRLLETITTLVTGNQGARPMLRELGRELGLPLLIANANGGVLGIAHSGTTYHLHVIVVLDTLMLSLHSAVKFPSGRLPQEVADMLSRRNPELGEWQALHNLPHSSFVLRMKVRRDLLHPELVRLALSAMLPEVVALDRTLEECGYVR